MQMHAHITFSLHRLDVRVGGLCHKILVAIM